MKKRESKLIVIVPMPGILLLDVAGPADVFTMADKALHEADPYAANSYELMLASPVRSKKIKTRSGVELDCASTVWQIERNIDTLIIAGFSRLEMKTGHPFFDWLRNIYPSVRRIASVCIGTYALAEAGLLNGRHATTHWEFSHEFQQRYPEVMVDSDPFYTRDGNVYTSGGVASGIDLSLALVEEDHGHDVALLVARKLVLQLKRPGYQSQYGMFLQVYSFQQSLAGKLHPWLTKHLHNDLSVDQLAARCNMSTRNFTRVFFRETGMTPAKFVERLRVEVARKYLEDSDLTLDQVAGKCGLGSAISMRRTFMRQMMISPSDYRRTFRTSLLSIA
jgi:transcriptional regulator GlxA family with amidase domain